jgi:phage-related protein
MKDLEFIGTAQRDLKEFPENARREAGYELHAVQCGLQPSDFKPMPIVGAGVQEIRINEQGAWRVMYVAKFAEKVYVLHAFQKKTQQTRQEDIALAAQRYKQIATH